ncbi:ABC transporter substrate-binding protein [Sporosarcina sp. G11-34]|uniref:ABC transporter substrate-binding protein n=1 Tax=Sporosarcina sp. G11-34 TaxID=2849605 RepID=UPI0022A9A43A|nr:ABC transporter substrate-binding protein [Sporosarcina sp. G11-34]MCZ2257493.1 ABC transporter substrate-binding protein [Sporosarcina sp. G11-34]
MKKIWKLWLLSIVAVFMLAACGGTATPDTPKIDDTPKEDVKKEDVVESASPVTVTDSVGNEITLETAPATIVSMTPSNTEILFELGLSDEIIGVNDYDDYPAEALEKEKIGGMEFNVEKIVAMNPDIVFGHESGLSTGEAGYEQIRAAGIPVFIVKNATNFDETYTTIEEVGKLTGKTEEAEKIIAEMKEKVEEVLTKVATVENKKTVFVETSPAPEIYTAGKDTFMQEMFDMVGADNVATEEGWFMIDPEAIISKNPDVIIVMYDYIETAVEDVYAREGFDTITAIKEKAVIQVQENITSRTGPRLAEGLEAIAKAIYPEVFSE